MALNIVLHEPEIPANTGNIVRTCAATGTRLHLIKPLGFSTDDKMLKRAGLDYWHFVDIKYYDSIQELYDTYPQGRFFMLQQKQSVFIPMSNTRMKTFWFLERKPQEYLWIF